MTQKPIYEELEKRIQELEFSEKALLESEHKLKIHIQDTPVGVTSWSLDFKVVEWNPTAEAIFGYTKAEALGKHTTELILPEDVKGLVDDIFNDLISQKGGAPVKLIRPYIEQIKQFVLNPQQTNRLRQRYYED